MLGFSCFIHNQKLCITYSNYYFLFLNIFAILKFGVDPKTRICETAFTRWAHAGVSAMIVLPLSSWTGALAFSQSSTCSQLSTGEVSLTNPFTLFSFASFYMSFSKSLIIACTWMVVDRLINYLMGTLELRLQSLEIYTTHILSFC